MQVEQLRGPLVIHVPTAQGHCGRASHLLQGCGLCRRRGPGPTEALPLPRGPEREESKGLEPQTSLAHSPLPFSHFLLPSLPAASSPVSTVAGSLKPGQNGREKDLVEPLLSILRPQESLNTDTQSPIYLPPSSERGKDTTRTNSKWITQ